MVAQGYEHTDVPLAVCRVPHDGWVRRGGAVALTCLFLVAGCSKADVPEADSVDPQSVTTLNAGSAGTDGTGGREVPQPEASSSPVEGLVEKPKTAAQVPKDVRCDSEKVQAAARHLADGFTFAPHMSFRSARGDIRCSWTSSTSSLTIEVSAAQAPSVSGAKDVNLNVPFSDVATSGVSTKQGLSAVVVKVGKGGVAMNFSGDRAVGGAPAASWSAAVTSLLG